MKNILLSIIFSVGLVAPAHAITVSDCSFANPNADRILFWDDSAGDCGILTPGTDLSISGTTLNFTNSSGYLTSATAASTYTPLTRTLTANSPITGGGDLSANRSFGFDFSTNNTWTGTNKINNNSTSGFIVEQSGVKNNLFRVDTTNGYMLVNASSPVIPTDFYINSLKNTGLYVRQDFATVPSGQTVAFSASPVLEYTGAATINDHIAGVIGVSSGRTLTGGTSDAVRGLYLAVDKADDSKVTSSVLAAMIGSMSDTSTYSKTTGNQDATGNVMNVDFTVYPTYDGGTRTLNYAASALSFSILAGANELSGTVNETITGINLGLEGFGGGSGKFTGVGLQVGVTDFNHNYAIVGSNGDWVVGVDNTKLMFGSGTGNIPNETFTPDTFIRYTGSIWDFDIGLATTSIDFNRSKFDTDFNVWSTNSSPILHLDAGGGTSYIRPAGDSTAAMQMQNAAGTAIVSVDTTNSQLGVMAGTSTALAKVGGVVFDHFADAGNVGTGEDDLYSDTLPANFLAGNGDKVTATYGGIFSGAALATQELRAYLGGTKIYDSGALAIGAITSNWTLNIACVRESSSVVRCTAWVSTDFATLFPYSTYTRITGLTLSNTQILKITGEAAGAGAANNQIVVKLGYGEFKPHF